MNGGTDEADRAALGRLLEQLKLTQYEGDLRHMGIVGRTQLQELVDAHGLALTPMKPLEMARLRRFFTTGILPTGRHRGFGKACS